MKSTTGNTDTQSLIGQIVAPEYIHQEQERELLAADAADFEGYEEFSIELEESAWQGAERVGEVLIKKQCEHTNCPQFQCNRSQRIGGIEI